MLRLLGPIRLLVISGGEPLVVGLVIWLALLLAHVLPAIKASEELRVLEDFNRRFRDRQQEMQVVESAGTNHVTEDK